MGGKDGGSVCRIPRELCLTPFSELALLTFGEGRAAELAKWSIGQRRVMLLMRTRP